jgi:hypothetical protein
LGCREKNAEEILKWLNQLIFSERNVLYQFVYQPVIGLEYWQAVRSAGLGSTGVYGRVSAGRQVCGQNRIQRRFPKIPAHLRRAAKPNRRPHSYQALQP